MVKETILEIKQDNDGYFLTKCPSCSIDRKHTSKGSAKRSLNKDCNKCFYDKKRKKLSETYSIVFDETENKWCSSCPSCNSIQKYTRFDHAKSSKINGWLCKKCSNSSNNSHIGDEERIYNKFKKSSII